jgi:hypothetical protein
VVRASCPLIIKDGQDAHRTKLGNLFFGVPLVVVGGQCPPYILFKKVKMYVAFALLFWQAIALLHQLRLDYI